jgi:hypothetical protein
MKTFKLTVTEDELKALINHHHNNYEDRFNPETSERIHTLTKRLNKETPEIEVETRPATSRGTIGEFYGDPSPQSAQEQSAVEQVKIPEGW